MKEKKKDKEKCEQSQLEIKSILLTNHCLISRRQDKISFALILTLNLFSTQC